MDAIIEIQQKVNALEPGVAGEDIKALDQVLSDLGERSESQNGTDTIVKLMQSITKYVISKNGDAHPNAFSLLLTFASDLELLENQSDKTSIESRQILDRCITSFKYFKNDISGPSITAHEFDELKAVLLSVDWEISTLTLYNFDQVITRLKSKLKSNKVHFTFLRIMHSLGAYIARNGSHSDNDSINLLQSVFRDYEKFVHHPEMPGQKIRALVESNIQAYKELKNRVTGKANKPSVDTGCNVQSSESEPVPVDPSPTLGLDVDEDMPPALSHVDSETVADQSSLNILPESFKEDDIVAPAHEDKKPEQPIDVMGDLFSPKVTPADELLDAIHLAELHDPKQKAPMDMMNTPVEQGDGVKNYTPERGRSEPIPEIGNRLDEFFNLEVSKDSVSESKTSSTDKDSLPAVEPVKEDRLPAFEEPADDLEPGLFNLIKTDDVPASMFSVSSDSIEGELLPEPEPIPETEEYDAVELVPLSDLEEKTGSPLVEAEDDFEPELPLEIVPDDAIDLAEDVHVIHELDSSFLTEFQEDDDLADSPESADHDDGLIAALIDDGSAPSQEDEDLTETILNRLKETVDEPSGLAEKHILTQVLDDIASLNRLWENNSHNHNQLLLDLISMLSSHVHLILNDPGTKSRLYSDEESNSIQDMEQIEDEDIFLSEEIKNITDPSIESEVAESEKDDAEIEEAIADDEDVEDLNDSSLLEEDEPLDDLSRFFEEDYSQPEKDDPSSTEFEEDIADSPSSEDLSESSLLQEDDPPKDQSPLFEDDSQPEEQELPSTESGEELESSTEPEPDESDIEKKDESNTPEMGFWEKLKLKFRK